MTHTIFLSMMIGVVMMSNINENRERSLSKGLTSSATMYVLTATGGEEGTPLNNQLPPSKATLPGNSGKHGSKLYVPKFEELAKVHKFHKERVKRMHRYDELMWAAVKVLVILCHVAILVIAFLHVTPH